MTDSFFPVRVGERAPAFEPPATRNLETLDEPVAHGRRATVIIDPDPIVPSCHVHDNAIGRSVDETLRMVLALQTGALCPVDWKPGTPTLESRAR